MTDLWLSGVFFIFKL